MNTTYTFLDPRKRRLVGMLYAEYATPNGRATNVFAATRGACAHASRKRQIWSTRKRLACAFECKSRKLPRPSPCLDAMRSNVYVARHARHELAISKGCTGFPMADVQNMYCAEKAVRQQKFPSI
jgi:hypothetical protein